MALTAVEQGKETEMVCKVELAKPFTGAALAERVRATLDRRP